MKRIRLHNAVAKGMAELNIATRAELLDLLGLLASGHSLGMPMSRPMPSIAPGVHELRIHDRAGQYRVFYFTKHHDALLVFHMFKKKTQATPKHELETARERLEGMQ